MRSWPLLWLHDAVFPPVQAVARWHVGLLLTSERPYSGDPEVPCLMPHAMSLRGTTPREPRFPAWRHSNSQPTGQQERHTLVRFIDATWPSFTFHLHQRKIRAGVLVTCGPTKCCLITILQKSLDSWNGDGPKDGVNYLIALIHLFETRTCVVVRDTTLLKEQQEKQPQQQQRWRASSR